MPAGLRAMVPHSENEGHMLRAKMPIAKRFVQITFL
jgi:hypothetical protein